MSASIFSMGQYISLTLLGAIRSLMNKEKQSQHNLRNLSADKSLVNMSPRVDTGLQLL